MPAKRPIAERFWEKVDKAGNDECWNWNGRVNHAGYGQIDNNGKTCRSNRIVWELTYGPIPEGLHVLHKCDNPACVNPSHLFLGTHQDNMVDRERKGRNKIPYGEKAWNHKLKEEDVLKIRQTNKTKQELASIYGVSRVTISRIIDRETWRHI